MKLLFTALILLNIACDSKRLEQEYTRNQENSIKPKIETKDFVKSDNNKKYYFTNQVFVLNKMSLLDTFCLKSYIKNIGTPNSYSISGKEIYEEFGFNDYVLDYGQSTLNAGHGYLLNAEILDSTINFNNIRVGDRIENINSKLNTGILKGDTIRVQNINDDVLTFFLKNKRILKIEYYGSVL